MLCQDDLRGVETKGQDLPTAPPLDNEPSAPQENQKLDFSDPKPSAPAAPSAPIEIYQSNECVVCLENKVRIFFNKKRRVPILNCFTV